MQLFKNLEEKLNKIDKPKRFIKLNKNSLEDYYSNLREQIKIEFEAVVKDKEKKTCGLIKTQFAQKICESIKTKQDFTKLFKSELDFLLK